MVAKRLGTATACGKELAKTPIVGEKKLEITGVK